MPPDNTTIDSEDAQRFAHRPIPTPRGPLNVPAYAHQIRTKADVTSLRQNRTTGMPIEALVPLASKAHTTGAPIDSMLGDQDVPYASPRPLVVADIEAEALSVSCKARYNYNDEDCYGRLPDGAAPGQAVRALLDTSAKVYGGHGKPGFLPEWDRVHEEYSLHPVAQWAANRSRFVHSDTLTVPGPLLRANGDAVNRAVQLAREVVRRAQYILRHVDRNRAFEKVAVQFPVHYELTESANNPAASAARAQLHDSLAAWSNDASMKDTIVLLKLYDPKNKALGADAVSARIHTWGEIVRAVSDMSERFDGWTGVLEGGRFTVGAFDNGAHLVGSRVRGRRRIDQVITGGSSGPRPPPDLRMPGSLEVVDVETVQASYERTGTFRTPSWVSPRPYWEDDFKYRERLAYAGRVQAAAFQETANRWREARQSPRYSVRLKNMVDDIEGGSAVEAMCPTLT